MLTNSLRSIFASALVVLSFLSLPSVSQAASDTDVWLSSQRSKSDLAKMIHPNLAIGLESLETRKQIAKLFTVEAPGLVLNTLVDDVLLDTQSVDATSRFTLKLAKTDTGLPTDIFVSGNLAFSVALSFSGTSFHVLPRVERVFNVTVNGGIPLPGPIEASIPDWLQNAIIAYLQSRDLLQLPVQFAQEITFNNDAIPTPQTPAGALQITNSPVRTEIWVNSAAVLINRAGIIGLAEARFDLTLPLCSSIRQPGPTLKSLRFTEYGTDRVISEIGSKVAAVNLRGDVSPSSLIYEVNWRLNGVTISSDPIPAAQTGAFTVPLATVSNGYGLYSALVTAHGKWNADDANEMPPCVVGSLDIVKLQELSLTVPNPMTHAIAIAEYQDYFNKFSIAMNSNQLPFQLNALYLKIAKPTISDMLNRILNALGIGGKLDPSKIPPVRMSDAKIKVPDADTISCSPTRDCTPKRQCDLRICPFNEDQRGCHRDTWFGGYNDPVCEVEKAGENVRRRASQAECMVNASLVKLDCERLKKQEGVSCELEKASEKGLCEGYKETVRLMTPDGNLASVNGDFKFSGSLDFAFRRFALSSQMDSFTLAVNAGGILNTHADIEFIPLNVAGHILGCISKWKAPIDISAGLKPPGSFQLNGQITFDPNSQVKLKVISPAIAVGMTPPFIELFAQQPYLVPLCPVLFAAGVGEGIYSLLRPEYRSTLWTGDYTISPIELNFNTKIPGIEIPARFGWPALALKMDSTPGSIVWTR
jgi:hypothetical protein